MHESGEKNIWTNDHSVENTYLYRVRDSDQHINKVKR